jgi:septum formation protein
VTRRGSPPPLVLASASPRRAELLARLGLEFEIFPTHIPEDFLPAESPEAHAERLSVAKARAAAVGCPKALVIGSDTVVVRDRVILGKPRDRKEAVGMLRSLAGRTHRVISGLALVFPGGAVESGSLCTEVTFRDFGPDLARDYVETGEPMDKAGAYGIQGLGSALVQDIRGDYHTVMGLPIPLLLDLLERAGWRYSFGKLKPAED